METKPAYSNPLELRIIERIRSHGPITFTEYMEAVLYDPEYGYYTSGRHRIGFDGDYFTSPALTPAFGKTLARLMPLADNLLGKPDIFTALELGAGEGHTAKWIMDALQKDKPELFNRMKYICVERSGGGFETLPSEISDVGARHAVPLRPASRDVERIGDISKIESMSGVVFSNEFFDALPVHRVVMRADGLKEIMVTERNGKLWEIETDLSDTQIADYFRSHEIDLVEGQQAELCLAANEWINKVSAFLERGLIITIDYGYSARELYAPYRNKGTLLTFHHHKTTEDFYANIGNQDLTAHVNFSALMRWGKEAGIETLAFTDQLRFFLNLGIHEVFSQMEAEAPSFAQYQADVQSAKALITPGGMGETFKVLVQYKGLDEEAVKTLREKISSKYSFS